MNSASLQGKRILLGICGGIAVYKACDLARLLIRNGATVQAVLTPRAAQFVTPLTFAALTGQPAPVDEFPEPGGQPQLDVYSHLHLTRDIDCYIVVPATATTIAKLVTGQADNLVAGCYISCTAPVVIAPAMNTRMWQHAAVQGNVAQLRGRGHLIVEPAVGGLACGDQGAGRLADLEDIVSAIESALGSRTTASLPKPLAGRRIIVTAGGTREYIDPVRYITNASTGRLGLELSGALCNLGAQVDLVHTGIEVPAALSAQFHSEHTVRTAFDLEAALARDFSQAHGVCMLAAVADYGPAQYLPAKRKKTGAAWSLDLVETTDILAGLAARRQAGQVLCGVSLEDTDWLARAMKKTAVKHVDVMLAVELGADLPFGDNKLNCALVTAEAVIEPPALRTKEQAAGLLAQWLAAKLGKTGNDG